MRRLLFLLLLVGLSSVVPGRAFAQKGEKLDEMSLDRWKELRETERYQLQIAENYYRDKKWGIAADEYAKFQSLYEKSVGAPYAQLKWSNCQVHLRKHNTAIKDGYQAIIDYWPDSPEAITSAFYIGRTYKDIGQLPKAKAGYRAVLEKHPTHLVAVYSMSDLVDIAVVEKDTKSRQELLRKLTFEVKRNNITQPICMQAAQQLATLSFEQGVFEEGQKALETAYTVNQLPTQIIAYIRTPLANLIAGSAEAKSKGEKMADAGVGYFRTSLSSEMSEEGLQRKKWYAIADLYALSQRDDKVLTTFEQLTKALGPSDDSLGHLAAFYKSRNKYEEARTTYRKYQVAADGLAAVAGSYREQGNVESAVQTYNQLINQDAERALQWKAEVATTYRGAKKYKQAAETYNELIMLDTPNANKWRFQMANALRDAGQYKEAIANYRQCENFPENYKQMANCHRHLREYKEAISLYGQIVATDPGNAPWALLQAGYTREEAGEKEDAIQTFQAVCKKYPEDPAASTAHAHLQTKYKISVTLGGAKDTGNDGNKKKK